LVGSDHEWDWYQGHANAAERAAFANGRASRDAEVDALRAALRAVLAALETQPGDTFALQYTICQALYHETVKDDKPL
jgi:hypothetical protein